MKYLLLFFLLPLTLRAAPIALTDPTRDYDLFRASSVLEVQPGKVGIDALLKNPGTYAFAPTRNDLIQPNDRQKAYWFRVEVANPTQESFLLHFVYSGTERIEVYEVADGRVVNQRTFGRLVPEREHHFRYSKLFMPIQARQSDRPHTLYIYMAGLYNASPYFYARPTVNLLEAIHREDLFYGLYYGFILIISIYSLFLFVRLRDQDTLRYAVWVLFVGLQLGLYRGFTAEFLWPGNHEFEQYSSALAGLTGLLHVLFTLSFLRLKKYQPTFYRLGQVMIGAYILGIVLFLGSAYVGGTTGRIIDIIPVLALVEGVFSLVAGIRAYRQGFRPSLYYIIGNLVFFASVFVFLQYAYGRFAYSFWAYNSIQIGSGIEILLFTMALVYKVNLLKKRQDNAIREQLRLTEENKRLVVEQNTMLEDKVRQRTDELNVQKNNLQTTLTTLQTTQQQLIQKEKMASFGELVSGIAHEIQNPLNFVNNFAEISAELTQDLTESLQSGDQQLVDDLATDLRQNMQSIAQHGQRASGIVRAMLEHSRTSSGEHQLTDLNNLTSESVKLAHQVLLAKDKTTDVQLHTEFDPAVGEVDLVPQDLSRVLMNLLNNAYFATRERTKQQSGASDYQPQIWVSTENANGQVIIRIRDNGLGIPAHLQDKIFQPFFTTKPTGQGVGLGLSLSYDIITKGHGGQLTVQSEPGQFAEFTVRLPLKSSSTPSPTVA